MRSPADALRDPRPGDVLIYGPQWQSERIEVIRNFGGMVFFRQTGGAEGYFNLASWKELMSTAEVLHVAP